MTNNIAIYMNTKNYNPSDAMTNLSLTIPTPPGSKQHPLKRAVRLVDPTNNPTMIIGIPKIVAINADVNKGTVLSVWTEKTPDGKTRIIYEKS